MTIKELIEELQLLEKEYGDFKVGITWSSQVTRDTRITGRAKKIIIQQSLDISTKMLWIKGRDDEELK